MISTRSTWKEVAFAAARYSGAVALSRRAHRGDLRILAYHGVDAATDAATNFDGFQVEPGVFESHLKVLSRYHVMSLRDAVLAMRAGTPLPDHAVAITFDDGYLNNVETAAPILARHGMTATFFLTTGFVDGSHEPWWYKLRVALRDPSRARATEAEWKNLAAAERDRRVAATAAGATSPYPFMTWTQARSLAEQGHALGAHTVSHVSLGAESEAAVNAEIGGSFMRIAEMTGTTPVLFAYPYGRDADVPDAAVRCLRDGACVGAVTTTHGMNAAGGDVYRLKRFNITGRHSAGAVEAMVSGLHAV